MSSSISEIRFVEDGAFRMVSFPPPWLSIFAKPLGNGQYRPVTLNDAMQDERVLAAIDGPMFANCTPGASYATSTCADPRYAQLDKDDGILDYPNPGNAGDGVTLSIVGGAARWTRGGTIDPAASVGVQLYPALVADGQVASLSSEGSNGQRVGRAALLGLQDGSIGFGMAQDTLRGFAGRCRAAGAVWAGYTDGGGSTAFGYRPEGQSVRRWGNVADPRPVAVFLTAKPPVVAKSSYAVPLLVGAAALALVVTLGHPAVRRRILDV